MQSSIGLRYSAVLHGLLLLVLILGLPKFMHPKIEPEPQSISVDILPISPVSNVKPQEKTEPEKPKPKAEEAHEKKPTPATKTEAAAEQQQKDTPKDMPKPDVPLPTPQPKPAPKVEPKKTEKPKAEKKKKDDESLDDILKSVQKTAKADEAKKPTAAAKEPVKNTAKSQTYDASQPLSMSEQDAIRSQIQKHWDMPAGAKDAYKLVVTLHIEVAQDGAVIKVELAEDTDRYNSDSFFRAAVDSAIRAVKESSPIQNLPADKFGTWNDMTMTFDPKDALY